MHKSYILKDWLCKTLISLSYLLRLTRVNLPFWEAKYKIKLKFLFFLQENSVDFESQVVAQIDEVIAKLDVKKQELLASIASAVQTKITSLKEQKEKCDGRLTATKGLLEYTNEAIKESDHATFLLISNSLCSRCVFTT